jgi:hypothetical protein
MVIALGLFGEAVLGRPPIRWRQLTGPDERLIRPHPHLLGPSVEVRMTGSEALLVVLLIALGAVLGWRVARRAPPALDHARPRPSPRPLKPRTPQET